ncbi:TRAP transporter small permease [Halotalea alkalilenta]|uniref:TRAP transporter small permease n=1 Tax=Halotalea alkalilenta TaxID=376489 RepID=UPI000488C4AB|nr:TRAP transporter small permease [Halotalea alkalilenta]
MKIAVDIFYKLLEYLLVILMTAMVVMVFSNVVMRYFFNSGLMMSDELSRFCFVWVTFIGAVVAFHENAHLGIETLVQRFGRTGRLVCMAMTQLLVMFCAAIFFWGTWQQSDINASMRAPVSGLSMIWVYGIGYFTGGMIFIISALRLLNILLGRVTDAEIAAFANEYDDELAGERAQ